MPVANALQLVGHVASRAVQLNDQDGPGRLKCFTHPTEDLGLRALNVDLHDIRGLLSCCGNPRINGKQRHVSIASVIKATLKAIRTQEPTPAIVV
jgi:hypothetical protein